MNEETIAFKCGACQQVPDKPLLENKDFEIVAIEDTMDWADFKHDTPDLNSEIWERALNPPAEGDLKKVQVYFPFHMSVGETFWTLFRPAYSHFNGWEEQPDEINFSAFIKCRFQDIISKNEKRAWIHVRVEQVLFLKNVCNEMPPRDGTGYLDSFHMFGEPQLLQYKDWILLYCGNLIIPEDELNPFMHVRE
ncbi:hypothetical protein [Paenibacillus polymyxa]|uniref:hypothetical protein n=1 Tax=Paenibacillus polymyxa TaxID=1406 RepID=UPI0007EAD259|nr:hypothetical protein [Paenibacillus polymyxa]OAZ49340.1 hypothetical protein A9Z39_11750 [Paenibacillus polymyxa]